MALWKKKGSKDAATLKENSVFSVRLPKGAKTEVIDALNHMDNRSQTILNLVELVIVKGGIGEELLQSILAGAASQQGALTRGKVVEQDNMNVQQVSIGPDEADADIFANQALSFMSMVNGD